MGKNEPYPPYFAPEKILNVLRLPISGREERKKKHNCFSTHPDFQQKPRLQNLSADAPIYFEPCLPFRSKVQNVINIIENISDYEKVHRSYWN